MSDDLKEPKTLLGILEDNFAVVLMVMMAVIPVADAVMRLLTNSSLPAAGVIVQHLTLWICFAGSVIATRKNDLLSLTNIREFAPEGVQHFIRYSIQIIMLVSIGFMMISSLKLVISEYDFGQSLSFGLPVWIAQAVIPAGYALIYIHLLFHPKSSFYQRIVGILAIAVLTYISLDLDIQDEYFLWLEDMQEGWVFWVIAFLLLTSALFKMPIFAVLGGLALLLFWDIGTVISSFAIEIYSRMATNAALPALPLFTLAGYILAEGGASRRLVNLFQQIFGWIPGGVALATIGVCTFFTTFTGASGVTILAMGGLLKPALNDRGYSDRTSIGLITGASSMGVLFPPSLPIIMYGAIALQPIPDMFIGAFIPGLVLYMLVSGYGMYRGMIEVGKPQPFKAKAAWKALRIAKWEAFLPVFVLLLLFSGYATLVEAAALTAIYAFVSEFLIHRDLSFKKDFTRVISYSAVLIGGVLIILASALGLTNYMVDAQIPSMAIAFVKEHIQSPLVFLLALNIFLFFAGCVMDVYTAIVILSQLLVPLGHAFNLNPVHLGVIFLANLGVGYLTPPVGMNLFISSYRFKKSMPEVYKASFPILILSVIGVLLITYIPWLTTFLLDLTGGTTNVNIKAY